MPDWFPRSIFGAVLAAIYVVAAVIAVVTDRAPSGSGGGHTLSGMTSFLLTLPVSLLGELTGMRLNYRRNVDMIFAIFVCAVLVYFIGVGLGKLGRVISGN